MVKHRLRPAKEISRGHEKGWLLVLCSWGLLGYYCILTKNRPPWWPIRLKTCFDVIPLVRWQFSTQTCVNLLPLEMILFRCYIFFVCLPEGIILGLVGVGFAMLALLLLTCSNCQCFSDCFSGDLVSFLTEQAKTKVSCWICIIYPPHLPKN